MLTILSFIVVIGVIIFVHELGHFLAARSVGIRVETFSLGYPPKMIGRKVGDTEYCISWIPLGGYVKMSGMIDESLDGKSTLTGAPWEFASKNGLQKLWVILAGVLMNFVLAILIYTGVAIVKGVPEPQTLEQALVGAVSQNSPADEAGLESGDRIIAIDGTPIETWDDLTTAIQPHPEEEIRIVFEREGVTQEVPITPERKTIREEGQEREVGQIGIAPQYTITFRPASTGEILTTGVRTTLFTIEQVAQSVAKLVTGQASLRELGGPLLIAKLSGETAKQGMSTFLAFIAFISINIGCLNLLPVPALDGGHALIILIESAIRRELSVRVKMALQQAGMILLLALIVFIIWNDANRIFDFSWVRNIF